MNDVLSYRKAFFAALFLHVCLGFILFAESSTNNPVLVKEAKNEEGELMPLEVADAPKTEIVKAVSVNTKEVMETVNRLKQERAQQIKAEQLRQQTLNNQAEMAKKQRLQEQQHLARLKEETAKIALARKKQMEEEQIHLKQLALQKQQETKKLEELKKQQQALEKKQLEDTKKTAELKKKQALQEAQNLKDKMDKQAAAKSKAVEDAKEAKEQAEKAAAAETANKARQAKMAGEVDKYKALIIEAISHRWILPDNVDSNLSSQFRIRLAPDGAVLDVHLIRGSGDPILDRSAESAIFKASPLPVPADPATFNIFRDISLTVRPKSARG